MGNGNGTVDLEVFCHGTSPLYPLSSLLLFSSLLSSLLLPSLVLLFSPLHSTPLRSAPLYLSFVIGVQNVVK